MKVLFVKLFAKGYIHFIGGFLVAAISILSFHSTWQAMKIMDNGKTVEVTIVESPANCKNVTSRTGFCKLKYQQKVFNKKTKGKKYCHLVSGKENVLMLTNGEGDKLLFPGEYNPIVFLYSFAMLLLAVWFFYKGFKKNRAAND